MRGRREALRKYLITSTLTVLAIFILFGLFIVCILLLPKYLVHYSAGNLADRLSVSDRLKAQNDVRATLIQALGGMLVLIGATIGAIVTLRQVAITREGQITDRFTHAVDQLGQEAVDVRVGGIYALERIAKNSTSDRDAIFDILSHFIRRTSQLTNDDVYTGSLLQVHSDKALRIRKADTQAALTVVTRPPLSGEHRFVTFDRLDMLGAMLPDANLSQMSLVGVQLGGSWLRNADLRGAILSHGNLRKCELVLANLSGSNLDHADLREANLENADLSEASLKAADLGGAKLIGANLRQSKASSETRWPKGIFPAALGVKIEET
jgi:uncharacterized protein YjbI with pentapeptide repeats